MFAASRRASRSSNWPRASRSAPCCKASASVPSSMPSRCGDRSQRQCLFHEIISWKLRMFVPIDASGPAILAKVLERYPLARISDRAAVTCRAMQPNWRIASRARPRRCAVTISPTGGASATTGRSAMSGTRLAARCSCA